MSMVRLLQAYIAAAKVLCHEGITQMLFQGAYNMQLCLSSTFSSGFRPGMDLLAVPGLAEPPHRRATVQEMN